MQEEHRSNEPLVIRAISMVKEDSSNVCKKESKGHVDNQISIPLNFSQQLHHRFVAQSYRALTQTVAIPKLEGLSHC